MKLTLNKPCCNKSTIHSTSLTSIFLQGTTLICCALTTSTVKLPSSRLNTGFQYTPVASKATCVHPCSLSQSPSFNNSSVVVKEVRNSLCVLPLDGCVNKQTLTVFLCTSSPAQ